MTPMLEGIIQGFESKGAEFVKIKDDKIYFFIKKGSQVDNDSILKFTKTAFGIEGKRLFIKRI